LGRRKGGIENKKKNLDPSFGKGEAKGVPPQKLELHLFAGKKDPYTPSYQEKSVRSDGRERYFSYVCGVNR